MRQAWLRAGLALALGLGGPSLAPAQVRTIDPNQIVDGDLSSRPADPPRRAAPTRQDINPAEERYGDPVPAGPQAPVGPAQGPASGPAPGPDAPVQEAPMNRPPASGTYDRNDIFSAGERVFGKGAQGFGEIIEKILKDQGEPNAYIAGREASGAALIGLRYGSGIMSHRIEGDMPVYWTGPSVGFDIGGNASKVFVLVYNLYDSHDIFHRYPEGEGHLYLVGGFSATYLRRGNIVLIPVRLGVGVRAGVNVGYMKFRAKQHWLPF